ncbi:MAG: cobalamin-binding protein [Capsulimonadales bacterium]|nr:cobalamin-binding protein [Capsulimonadales bacterium]
MRIVSLLPSATEIVAALGLTDSLVAITHECDYPPEIVGRPVVTGSILPEPRTEDDEPLSALEIDERVRAAVEAGESIYRIDHDLLRELKPDLILTQGLCDVCAVNHAAVRAAVDVVGSGATVLDLAPTDLAGVLETFRAVGRAAHVEARADELVEQVRNRWNRVAERTTDLPARPRTLLLEWPEPPFSAGHWNPELLQLAGGIGGPWDAVGVPSRTLDWQEIREFGPEMIVLMACGFDTYRALWEASTLTDVPGWFDLPAVRNGDCYAVDGNAYFNRPGPRLAESAEILATILHPERFPEMLPPYAAQIFDPELMDPDKAEAGG